jgi:hypothetical protein
MVFGTFRTSSIISILFFKLQDLIIMKLNLASFKENFVFYIEYLIEIRFITKTIFCFLLLFS